MNDRDERLIDLLYGADAGKAAEGLEDVERAELDALRRTREVARALPVKSPSARVSAAILAEARTAAQARKERPVDEPARAVAAAAPAVTRKPVAETESGGGLGGFLRWLLRPGPATGLVLVAAALMIVVVKKGDKLTEVATPAADQAAPVAAAPAPATPTPALPTTEARLEAAPEAKTIGFEDSKDDRAKLDRRSREMMKPAAPSGRALGGSPSPDPDVVGGLGASRGEGRMGLREGAGKKASKADYGLADKAAPPAFAPPPPPPREPSEAKKEEAKPERPAKEAFATKAAPKAAEEPPAPEADRKGSDDGRAQKNLGKKGYVAPPGDADTESERAPARASKAPSRGVAPAGPGASQQGGAIANQAPAPAAPATTRSADAPTQKQAREERDQRKDVGADNNNLARSRSAKKRAGDNVADELEAPRMAEQRGNAASTQNLQNTQRGRDNVDHCARLAGESRLDCLASEQRCEEAERELGRLPVGAEARERLRKRIDACRVQREEDAVAERQQRRRGPAAAAKAKAKRAPAAAAEKAADKADALH